MNRSPLGSLGPKTIIFLQVTLYASLAYMHLGVKCTPPGCVSKLLLFGLLILILDPQLPFEPHSTLYPTKHHM